MKRILLAAFAGLFIGTAQAEVISDKSYTSYDVRGLTASEIWRDIGRKGPHQLERGLYAQAEAEIRWGWTVKFYAGRPCRVKDAEIRVTTVILLPRWVDEQRASDPLRVSWARYLSKVRAHEDMHHEIALRAAGRIEEVILATPAQPDCKTLSKAVERRAKLVLAQERRDQAHFDETDDLIYLEGNDGRG